MGVTFTHKLYGHIGTKCMSNGLINDSCSPKQKFLSSWLRENHFGILPILTMHKVDIRMGHHNVHGDAYV